MLDGLLQKWKWNSKYYELMILQFDFRFHYIPQECFRLLSSSVHFPVCGGYLFSHEYVSIYWSNISFNTVLSFSSRTLPFSFFHLSMSFTALSNSYLATPLLPHVNDGINFGSAPPPNTFAHIPTTVPVLNDV